MFSCFLGFVFFLFRSGGSSCAEWFGHSVVDPVDCRFGQLDWHMFASFRLEVLVPRLVHLLPSLGSQDLIWLVQWNISCRWCSVRWPAMPIWLCPYWFLPIALTSRCHPHVPRMYSPRSSWAQTRRRRPGREKIVPLLRVCLFDVYPHGGTWLNWPRLSNCFFW